MISRVDNLLDHEIDEKSFQRLANIVQETFGLELPIAKKRLVSSRIFRSLSESKAKNFDEYLNIIEQGNDESEMAIMISALTTNVTSFFREKHHFLSIANNLAPEIQKAIDQNNSFRVWSAGCASGEEAFSIAMTLKLALPDKLHSRVKILGTDIDSEIIKKAKIARLPIEAENFLPREFIKKLGNDVKGPKFTTLREEVVDLVQFAELNLLSPWPFAKKFSMIFCRNVAIYFNRAEQDRLWSRLSDQLAVGGHLFIGHSERVSDCASRSLQLVGITTYKRMS